MAFGDVFGTLLGLGPVPVCACLAAGAVFSAVALAKCSRRRGPKRRRRGFRAFVAFETRIIIPSLGFFYLWTASSAILLTAVALVSYLVEAVPALVASASALSVLLVVADVVALLVSLAVAEVALRVLFEGLYLSAKAHETIASYKHPYFFEGGEDWVVPPSEASGDDLAVEGGHRPRSRRVRGGRRVTAAGDSRPASPSPATAAARDGASPAAAPASASVAEPAPAPVSAPAAGVAPVQETAPASETAHSASAAPAAGTLEPLRPVFEALYEDAFAEFAPACGMTTEAPAASEPPAPSPSTWDCACGSRGNEGAFCGNCGAPRPSRQ